MPLVAAASYIPFRLSGLAFEGAILASQTVASVALGAIPAAGAVIFTGGAVYSLTSGYSSVIDNGQNPLIAAAIGASLGYVNIMFGFKLAALPFGTSNLIQEAKKLSASATRMPDDVKNVWARFAGERSTVSLGLSL